MKRLLFILSCLMIVSLSYADTVYGRLEKLEGNCATVHVYPDNGTPQVVTLNLKDTEDKYLHQPLRAEGQGVFVYNGNTLSQVDEDAARRILQVTLHEIFCMTLVLVGVAFILSLKFKRIEAQIISKKRQLLVKIQYGVLCLSLFITANGVLGLWLRPQLELVNYGRVSRLERWAYIIEDENGNKQIHDISGSVWDIYYYADGTWGNPTTEGGIIKGGNSYKLYQSFGKDRKVIEATIRYVNEKTAFQQRVLKYLMFIVWICTFILYILPLLRARIRHLRRTKVETARLKVEKKRQEQKLKKQPEYRRFCEELVTKFWVDYLDSPEETSVLLARLKVALQNSGYQKWQEEFYDVVEKQTKERTRPPKEQRQKASNQVKDEELDDIRINFNGLFVTAAQYRILSSDINAQSLSLEDLIIYCRKLAEKMPEFRDFLEGKVVRTTQMLTNANEAYELFKLTPATLTEASLKQAYRRLVQQYHPDKNKDPKAAEMFQKVRRYYAYLKGELRRKAA